MSSPAAAKVDPREHEVRLLVDMVRLSRSTLLIAESGAEKSALIQSKVLPLFNAVRTDGKMEVAILLDVWDQAPLLELQTRLEQTIDALGYTGTKPAVDGASLATSLKAWQEALGTNFIFIFDRFEQYLRAPLGRTGFEQFEEQLVEVIKDPTVRANFLLSLDDAAEPLLQRLRERIPRFGYSRVRLPQVGEPNDQSSRPVRESSVVAMARKLAAESQSVSLMAATRGAPAAAAPQAAPAMAAPEAAPAMDRPASKPVTPKTRKAEKGASQSVSAELATHSTISQIATQAASPPANTTSAEISPAEAESPVAAEMASHSAASQIPTQAASPAALMPGRPLGAVSPADADPRPVAAIAPKAAAPKALPEPLIPRVTVHAPAAKAAVGAASAQRAASAAQASRRSVPKSSGAEQTRAQRPLRRFVWASVAVAAGAIAFLLYVKPQRDATGDVVAKGEVAKTLSDTATPKQGESTPQEVAKSEPRAAREVPPEPVSSTPRAPAASTQTVQAPRAAEIVVPQAPAPAARQLPAVASPAQPSRTPEPAQTTAAAAPPISRGGQPEIAAKAPPVARAVQSREPSKPTAAPPSPRGAPLEVVARPTVVSPLAQPQNVAGAPVAAPVPAGAAETVSVPRLYINVRNEAQRVWAEQIIRPLGERGIRVAGIRVVNSGPEEADLRYYNQSDRNEVVKVAVALRDFGLRAQQLKHLDDIGPPAAPRQYELWLPANAFDQRP
ncbi:MAG TPA: hypothetical protein VGO18_29625 [Steroidobacteraceae bacterium]|nr:hypothetical protein [Steroidobacteraceae bacterium]